MFVTICNNVNIYINLLFQIGTMASLNASTTHSLAGSRPTTPHSTVSTAPV